jgi:type I restriction enzyme S subunit
MNEWKEVQLSEVCNLIAGFAFKSKDFGNYPDKVIKIANINPPYINMNNSDGVNLESYDIANLKKYIVREGDYVLAMTGATIGKIGKMVYSYGYLNQRVLLFKEKQGMIDKEFLYYVLSGNEFLPFIIIVVRLICES